MNETPISYSGKFSLEENVRNNFKSADKQEVLSHTLQVRFNALTLARRFALDEKQAATAALLHDISTIIPAKEYIDFAQDFGLEIYEAEYKYPPLLHQRLSRIIAVDIFNIGDKEVLNAIACHTTLRKNATPLDKLLFLADKTSWADKDMPPYIGEVNLKLDKSLDEAADCYILHLMENRDKMPVVHPWLVEAWQDSLAH